MLFWSNLIESSRADYDVLVLSFLEVCNLSLKQIICSGPKQWRSVHIGVIMVAQRKFLASLIIQLSRLQLLHGSLEGQNGA